jgi:hypothetical protein
VLLEATDESLLSIQNLLNFKGNWSDLTGALSQPATVYHSGAFWVLATDLADVTASEPTSANTDWLRTIPEVLRGNTLAESKYNQIADASVATGTHTFDYSLGDMQEVTITGDITIAFSNFPTGELATFIIDAINWGAFTVLYPAGIVFAGKTAPSYTSAGRDRLLVIKDKDEVYSLFIIGKDIGVVT